MIAAAGAGWPGWAARAAAAASGGWTGRALRTFMAQKFAPSTSRARTVIGSRDFRVAMGSIVPENAGGGRPC